MKKQQLLCIFILLQLNALAQTEKGSKLVGVALGTLNYTNQTERYFSNNNPNPGPPYTTNSFNLSVTPSFAWVIAKNFAMGPYANCSYSYTQFKPSGGSVDNKIFELVLGPQTRGYLSKGEKGKCFIDVFLGIGFLSGKQGGKSYYQDEYKISANGSLHSEFSFG